MSSSYTSDGRYIAAASEESTVRIWDSKAGREVRVITLPVDPNFVGFAANDCHLFIHGSDNKIHIV